MRLTALVVVSRQIQRDAVRHLPALERHGLDELDVGAVLATLANQRGRIVEIAQELSAATPHSRGGEDVALRALVPLDQLLHVHLEEDLPDGRGVLLVGEVGGDLPDSDGRGVQDGLAAVELVVQEVCRVPRRVGWQKMPHAPGVFLERVREFMTPFSWSGSLLAQLWVAQVLQGSTVNGRDILMGCLFFVCW